MDVNQHGRIATRLLKSHLIMQGHSLSVYKVLVRLKDVQFPRQSPNNLNGRNETQLILQCSKVLMVKLNWIS